METDWHVSGLASVSASRSEVKTGVFEATAGRISNAWGLEDTYRRLRQLGLA
jgi:hypothetical protein